MTAPKPATALPTPLRVVRLNGTGKLLNIVSANGGVIAYSDYENRADAIVAACNAYPQLVEDRARLVEALEGLSAMGVLDARGSDSHESAQRRADACALLRELEGK